LYTSLHVVSSFRLKAIVEALLNQGADIEAKYKNKEIALCIAAIKGDIKVVKLLLDKGADVEAKGNSRKRALY
jgi:ankyrin repeat protein